MLGGSGGEPCDWCSAPQIQLKEIFETDTDIALVLELVTGGELFDRLAPHAAGTRPFLRRH